MYTGGREGCLSYRIHYFLIAHDTPRCLLPPFKFFKTNFVSNFSRALQSSQEKLKKISSAKFLRIKEVYYGQCEIGE